MKKENFTNLCSLKNWTLQTFVMKKADTTDYCSLKKWTTNFCKGKKRTLQTLTGWPISKLCSLCPTFIAYQYNL